MIKTRKYNDAKKILGDAGSDTAQKSHDAHGDKDVPDEHGKQLLREAREEFRRQDAGQNGLQSGMTQAHYDAVHKAADVMGIGEW